MKKRLLSLLLASIMAVSVCACGNSTGESEVVSKETTEEGKEQVSTETMVAEKYVPTYPIVDEKITITALVVGQDTSVSKTRLVWDEVEKVTNIHIEWENIDKDAFATRLASGDWPDLIASSMNQTAMYDYGVIGGKFVNYLDYIDIMPNLKKALEDYPDTLAYATQLNGEVYNLFRISGDQAVSVNCRPHYRKDVLAAAGITEEPTSIEEFYDVLVKLKEYYGEASFIHEKNITSSYNQSLFGAFGDLTQMDFPDDGTGTLVFARTSEQMKLYYEFMHKLYEEGLMHKEYLTLDSKAILNLVQGGTIAFFPQSSASKLTINDLSGDWDNLGTLSPFTSEYDETAELCAYPDYNDTHGMYINAESKYIEEICKMLDICFAEEEVVEGSNLRGVNFSSGPEFIAWTDNGDGTFTEITPEGFDSRTTYMNQAYIWTGVGRADEFAGMLTSTPGNTQARQMGYVTKIHPYMNDIVVSTKHLRLTEEEQYIIDNKYGEIKTYFEQMEAEFISGASSIEEKWDEYVATLEKMGAADVLAVYQAAYDRLREAMAALNK